MARLKVTVENDVYAGDYFGESIEVTDAATEPVLKVRKADGEFTVHRPKHVTSIELTNE